MASAQASDLIQLKEHQCTMQEHCTDFLSCGPTVVTPTAASTEKQTTTPDTVLSDASFFPSPKEADCALAPQFEALADLSKGMIILTRLMQSYHISDLHPDEVLVCNTENPKKTSSVTSHYSSQRDSAKCSDYLNDECQTLSDLTEKLDGVIGPQFSSLVNTAHMLREHAQLSSKEASLVVEDLEIVRRVAIEAQGRAENAVEAACELRKKNTVLKKEVRRLIVHNEKLTNELASLQKELRDTRKYDAWRLLEDHVIDSLRAHETHLTLSSQNENEGKVDEGSDTAKEEETVSNSNSLAHQDGMLQAVKAPNKPMASEVADKFQEETSNREDWSQQRSSLPAERAAAFLASGASVFSKKQFRQHDGRELRAKFGKNSVSKIGGRDCNSFRLTNCFMTSTCRTDHSGAKKPGLISVKAQKGIHERDSSKGFRMNKIFGRATSSQLADRKSPLLSLEDITPCDALHSNNRNMNSASEDSVSVAVGMKETTLSTAPFSKENVIELGTTIVGNTVTDVKPICDPNAIRILAVPSTEDTFIEELESPRTIVGPGLYLV